MAKVKSESNLFTDFKGEPMSFEIQPNDPYYNDIKRKVTTYGGEVIEHPKNLDQRQRERLIKLSSYPIDSVTFSSRYIDDSIKRNQVLDLEPFTQISSSHIVDKKRKAHEMGDEDRAAVETAAAVVANHDKQSLTDVLTTTAAAAAAAAAAAVANDNHHHDASILNKDTIDYYTHQEEKLQNIQRKNHSRKKTSKFNDEKDLFIMEQVRLKPRYRTSHKFYDDLANLEMLQGHTGHSVRSRCRVHLLPKIGYFYKTDDFGELVLDDKGEKVKIPASDVTHTLKNRFSAEEDYSLCTEVLKHVLSDNGGSRKRITRNEDGDIDERLLSVGISFFDEFANQYPNHSSPSWRDRFRKFAKAYGVQKYIRDYEECIRNNQIPEAMKNLTRRKIRKRDSSDRFVTAADDEEEEEALVNGNEGLAGALDEEIGELKSSNIDEALKEVDVNRKNEEEKRKIKQEFHNQNTLNQNTLNHHQSDSEVESDSNEILVMPESASQAYDINYVSKNVKIDDILTNEFFKIEDKKFSKQLNKILKDVSKNAPNDKEGDLLFKEFNKIGIKPIFTSHILMVSSSNALSIHNYLKAIFKKFKKADNIPDFALYDFLLIDDKDGLWTPKQDKRLRKGKFNDLKNTQTDVSINERTSFLKENGKW